MIEDSINYSLMRSSKVKNNQLKVTVNNFNSNKITKKFIRFLI